MKITGKITKVLDVQKGTTKEGKEWQKLAFVVTTGDEYNNLYCFDVFGDEKVENFTKFQKEGNDVEVEFNVKTNEWKGKYYTSLQAWLIKPASEVGKEVVGEVIGEASNDLPF